MTLSFSPKTVSWLIVLSVILSLGSILLSCSAEQTKAFAAEVTTPQDVAPLACADNLTVDQAYFASPKEVAAGYAWVVLDQAHTDAVVVNVLPALGDAPFQASQVKTVAMAHQDGAPDSTLGFFDAAGCSLGAVSVDDDEFKALLNTAPVDSGNQGL